MQVLNQTTTLETQLCKFDYEKIFGYNDTPISDGELQVLNPANHSDELITSMCYDDWMNDYIN